MDERFVLGANLPSSVGQCADLYHEIRTIRLAMDKEVKRIKDRENEIKEHIIANLSKSEDTGAAGKRYRAQIKEKRLPRVVDWAAFHAFIMQHGRLDLLQKRTVDKPIMEMHEAGELPPGLETMLIPDVSITKI